MFKISLVRGQAYVSLMSNDGNQPTTVMWEGDSRWINIAQGELEFAYGAFGHILNPEFTTPIDLHYAVFSKLKYLVPSVVEGAELVESYDPGIPEGAVT